LAASDKVVKYAGLSSPGEFVPIAMESHDPVNRDALQFILQARGILARRPALGCGRHECTLR